ncbi:MAG: serpin family protein [Phycisphaerales bacterium]
MHPISKPSLMVLLAPVFLFAGLAAGDVVASARASVDSTAQGTEQAAEQPAVAASNGFGIDLYRALVKADPAHNLFISPYSMAVALTMAAEGARGETEEEMAKVLHFPAATRPEESAATTIQRVHGGHAALAQRFLAAAGNTDPQTQARIAALRTLLDEANGNATKFQQQQKWKESGEANAQAQRFAAELNTLLTQVDRFDLRIANALWVERTFSLLPSFVQAIDRFYGTGGVTQLNIAGETEQSRARINAWVEEHTERRIKDLIPVGGLAPDIRLVITNAVYFKGQWADPFSEGATRDEPFALADGKTVPTKLMRDQWRNAVSYAAFSGDGAFFATPREVPADADKLPKTYPDDDGFSMIELPYKGGELSMVVIAPRAAGGLGALEQRLTADALDAWPKRLERRTVDTAIPRFKMASSHEMSPPLQALGMKRAFINPALPGGAQFGGMSASADPAQQLYIGGVLHKAWIEVTEKGTEAAAATAVMMAPGARAAPVEMVPFIPQFRADRPFLYLIRDAKSGVILFIGRMVDPRM